MRHLAFAMLVLVPACSADAPPPDEQEVITTVILTMQPPGDGPPLVFEFDDPDGDGGAAPTIDPIVLTTATDYPTAVRFENRLETPAEDITLEVRDEDDQHQLFFTGTAINGGVLTHMYADSDANGLPVGLQGSIAAVSGTGDLTVTLRHLPPINGTATKTAGLETQVRNGGFDGVPGETDVQVTFPVTVP